MDDRDWKRRFGAADRPGPADACPAPDVAARWTEGPLPEDAVAHLAGCASCREDLVVLRRVLTQKSLQTRKWTPWIGVAAAAAVLILLGAALLLRAPEPAPAPVVVTPPKPKSPAPLPAPRPEAPAPVPEPTPPAPKPETPAPTTIPEKTPAPPAPAPEPPPAPVPPAPAPEKPAPSVPAPTRPAPEPTVATLPGTLRGVFGSCLVQLDGDAAAQSLKAGQKRDFPGAVRLKAELAAAKVAVGSATYYVQRGAELSLQLQEGRTRVQLARGEVFFDVAPGNGLFDVESPHAKVTVKGTRFLVAAEKTETEVLVQRGAVDVAAAGQSLALAAAGKAPSAAQKADPARRLAWVRGLEDSLWIEAEQLAVQGGMTVLADATASGGRAIGLKDPPKAGVEAAAEIRGKRKQSAPYAVWVRLCWPHNVPPGLTLSIGDALHWSAKDVASAPGWQWVRAGSVELPDDTFRLRLTDTKAGLKVDQLLITSDPDFNPETDKR